jgi:hypothetical protein
MPPIFRINKVESSFELDRLYSIFRRLNVGRQSEALAMVGLLNAGGKYD